MLVRELGAREFLGILVKRIIMDAELNASGEPAFSKTLLKFPGCDEMPLSTPDVLGKFGLRGFSITSNLSRRTCDRD